ncbi:MAG: trypsin-like peptidase domain-containing protein [Candidatus Cryosericum sp.]
MHRTARAAIVLVLVLALLPVGASHLAQASSAATIILHVDSTRMDVDGAVVWLDAAPVIIEGRTLLPIRPVVDALEGQISWDATERKVTVVRGSTSIEMWISNPIALLNGARTQIDPLNARVTPLIVKSRTMLPLRFVASALGGQVAWEPTERRITLTFAVAPPVQPPEQPLTAPQLQNPAEGVTLDASTATFSWALAQGAATYTLRISDLTGAKVYEASSLSGTSRTIPNGTLGNGSYSWQVTAFSKSGKSSTSSTFSFSVRRKLTTQEIASMRRAVVYVQVSCYKSGTAEDYAGSGFFISSDGLIVTNYHVIDGAVTGTVKLDKELELDAGRMLPIESVLGYDKQLDLAILRVRGDEFPTCRLGDSEGVTVGDSVVAIGSPGGMDWWQNTVSEGIISGIRATRIQTTTPITGGSSGGALFDAYGEVIGVTVAVGLTSEGEPANDVSLFVPIDKLKEVGRSNTWTLAQVYEREHGPAPALPQAPVLVAPVDGAEAGVPGLALAWEAVAGADRYDVWIGTGRTWGDSRVVLSQQTATTSLDLPIQLLAAGASYSWSVRAHNKYGWGSWSQLSHFTTVQVPLTSAPLLLSPKDMDGMKSGQVSLNFSWSGTPGATGYHFFLGRPNPVGAAFVVLEKDVTVTACSVPGSLLLAGEVYTWSVTASADGEADQKSLPASFSMYKYGSPAFRPKGTCGSASTVCWTRVGEATKYVVRIYKGSTISPGNEWVTETMGAENTDYVTMGWFDKESWYCGYVMAMSGDYVIGVSTTFSFFKRG